VGAESPFTSMNWDHEVGLPLSLNTDASRFGFSFLRLHNPPWRTGGPLIGALHDAFARFPNATFADRTSLESVLGELSSRASLFRSGAAVTLRLSQSH
jgi:hypothetical protein